MNSDIKYTLVHAAAGLMLIVIMLVCHAWAAPVFFITFAAAAVLWLLCIARLIRNIRRSKSNYNKQVEDGISGTV
jgi:membrane protein implicated in regulation of membrane protease activity